jgi:hypothetical protein
MLGVQGLLAGPVSRVYGAQSLSGDPAAHRASLPALVLALGLDGGGGDGDGRGAHCRPPADAASLAAIFAQADARLARACMER